MLTINEGGNGNSEVELVRTESPRDPRDLSDFVTAPFTVAIDTREQAPFAFRGIHSDARQKRKLLLIPTTRKTLHTGDYSIEGYESEITIERKSLEDLYGTLGQGRDRFERELERIASFQHAFVVVEASWMKILESPPPQTRLAPKSVYRSILAWQQRIPHLHWWACHTRRFAEITTFRILERFFRDNLVTTARE